MVDFNEIARKGLSDKKIYEPGKSVEEVMREIGVERVIKMASNENPLGPSPLAIEAIGEALTDIHIYPDGHCTELREKLSKRLGVEPRMLFFGNGADEVIASIFNAFFDPGDVAVMGEPTFSSYELSCVAAGGIARGVPLVDHRHDVEAMASAVDDSTKAVFIASPHNPTGTIVTEEELQYLLDAVPGTVLVVWDEAYREFVEDPDFPDVLGYLGEYPNLISLRTFSKLYGLAGLRVGYAVSSPGVVGVLEKVKLAFNVSALSQVAAVAALDDEKFVKEYRRMNSQERERLTRELSGMGFETVPSQANFIWFGYRGVVEDLPRRLLEMGIIVRDGKPFGAPGYVRLTVGTPEQNNDLLDAVEKLMAEDR